MTGIGTPAVATEQRCAHVSGLLPADTKDSRSTTLRSCAEGAVVRLERAVPTAMDRGRTRDKLRGAASTGVNRSEAPVPAQQSESVQSAVESPFLAAGSPDVV